MFPNQLLQNIRCPWTSNLVYGIVLEILGTHFLGSFLNSTADISKTASDKNLCEVEKSCSLYAKLGRIFLSVQFISVCFSGIDILLTHSAFFFLRKLDGLVWWKPKQCWLIFNLGLLQLQKVGYLFNPFKQIAFIIFFFGVRVLKQDCELYGP